MGFSAKILNNSVSAITAQQAVIATTSNNIANANTAGYARRSVDLETRGGSHSGGEVNVGNGVEIGKIVQHVDEFIEKLLRDTTGDKESGDVKTSFLQRIETLFSINESMPTIGSTLTEFKNSANDLAANPASIQLRSNFIERGKDLVNAITQTFNALADLQDEANSRVITEVETVNTLAAQIANLNSLVITKESTGNLAADERDQRTKLLGKLAEKVGFSTVEESNGQVNVYLQKGFALVSGSTARELEVTTSPSFSSGSVPPSLSGQTLGYIVYDYDTSNGSAHIDLTQALQSGGGTIGGLLQMRGYNDVANTSAFSANGTIVEIASRVEAISRSLLTTINRTYLGAQDEDSGTTGYQASSGDLDGNSPTAFGLFDFTYNGSTLKDSNPANGLPELSDLTVLGIDNFSSILTFKVTDPRDVAAALDVNTAAGSTTFPSGDGRNILALVSKLDDTTTSFAVGGFSYTGSFDQAYNESVTTVGALSARAKTETSVAEANYSTALSRRESISGVSLDEEFSNLIKFQRAFQASSRMIKVADDLLNQIVSLI